MVGDKTMSENSEAPSNDENVEFTSDSKPQSEGRKHSILQEFVRLNDRLARLNSGFHEVSGPILYRKRDIGQNLQAPVGGVDKESEDPRLVGSNIISERSEAEMTNHEKVENKLGDRELESELPRYTEINNKLAILRERYSAVSTRRISYRRKEDNDGCNVDEEALLFGIISSMRAKRENSDNAIHDLRTRRKALEDQNSLLVPELEEAVHKADELQKAVDSKKQSKTIVHNLKSKLTPLDKESSELIKNLIALKENEAVLQRQVNEKDAQYSLHKLKIEKKKSEAVKALEENIRKQKVDLCKWMMKKNEDKVSLLKAQKEELQKERQFKLKAKTYEKTVVDMNDKIELLNKSLLAVKDVMSSAENKTDEGIADVESVVTKLSACSGKLQMMEDNLCKLVSQMIQLRLRKLASTVEAKEIRSISGN